MRSIKTLLVAAFSFVAISAVAQDFSQPQWARYGDTPEERKANALTYNFYRDAYNNRNWSEVTKFFPELVAKCPKASVNLYIYAATAYKNRIAGETDQAKRDELIDSLLYVYDKRIENYGDDPKYGIYVSYPLKAREYITYKPTDREGVRKICNEVIEACGENVDPDFVVLYFSELTDDYKNLKIEDELLYSEYQRLEDLVANDAEATSSIESLFASSGAANCENLEKLFRPKIEAAPNDVDLLSRAFNLMSRASDCETNDFYLYVVEQYHAVQPSATTAEYLAKVFQDRKENDKAIKYINEAMAVTEDPIEKAKLYVRIAGIEISIGNYSEAASAARSAREADPENGWAYFFLAQAYAATTGGCNGIDRNAVYWVAYDTMSQARSLVEQGDDAEAKALIPSIDKMLGSYRAAFPSVEDGFFNDLTAGSSYTVKCGLASGITTTVRFK